MKIFLTNDDGIHAVGIRALIDALSPHHEVLVIAPDGERSGASHSLSIRKPLILQAHRELPCEAYSLSGTPADCTKFLILHRTDFQPDLIISGINAGENIGRDVMYSGTVNAAMEGAQYRRRAIALSVAKTGRESYTEIASFVSESLPKILSWDFSRGIYNLNFPSAPRAEWRGLRAARLALQTFEDSYVPQGEGVYMLDGPSLGKNHGQSEDTDIHLVNEGYVTVTPLICDRTDRAALGCIGEEEW